MGKVLRNISFSLCCAFLISACATKPLPIEMAEVACNCLGNPEEGSLKLLRSCTSQVEEKFKDKIESLPENERKHIINDYKISFKECAGQSITSLSVKYALRESLGKDTWESIGKVIEDLKENNGNANINIERIADRCAEFGEALGETVGDEFDEKFARELESKLQRLGQSIERNFDEEFEQDMNNFGESLGKIFESIGNDIAHELDESFEELGNNIDEEISKELESLDNEDFPSSSASTLSDIQKEIDDVGLESERFKKDLREGLIRKRKPD